MKKTGFIILALLMLAGCASKRYAKKGAEFEKSGYYEKAAEMYLASVIKNSKNVEATIGLKRNAQLTLDKKLGAFLNHYNADESKEAVYKYIESKDYYNTVLNTGVELVFPSHYKDYYDEVKKIYLESRYNEAYLFLVDEEFVRAETILNEILFIEPYYQDAAVLLKTAHYEPIYRKGKEFMLIQKYRSAYYSFKKILDKLPNYKDTKELSEKALNQALITIALVDFANKSRDPRFSATIQSKVEQRLIGSKSPFIKLIDRSNTQHIKNEQLLTLEGKVDSDVSAKAGKMYGVKALLTGQLDRVDFNQGKLEKNLRKGYLKEKVVEKKEGEPEEVTYNYHKTYYNEFSQSNSIYCTFQFKLISAETGEVMVSDVITLSIDDQINYATYDGDIKNLVKGSWTHKDKDTATDLIKDNVNDNKELATLLNGRKQIKSMDELSQEITNSIAEMVALKINLYDPEK
jgi:hypothetical protein